MKDQNLCVCRQKKKKKEKMSAQLSSFVDHSTTSCAALALCESLSLTPSWESSEGERGRSWILSARAIAKDKTQRGANSSSSLQRICSAGPQVAQRGGFLADVATAAPAPGGSLFALESQLPKTLPKHVWRSRSRRLGGSQRGFLG